MAAFTFNTLMSQGTFGNLCDTDNFGDPVVLYDTFEDRWIITDFAFKLDGSGNVNPQHAFECFAVSKTGDPVTGGWNFYSIEIARRPRRLPQVRRLARTASTCRPTCSAIAAGASFQGTRVWALNKAQMYAGAPTVQVVTSQRRAATSP